MGSSFLENFPTFLDDMWALDSGFKWLAGGVPRWIPLRASTKAHLARARLNRTLAAFHRMLDRSAAGMHDDLEWIDVSDVSKFMKQRNKTWREAGIPPERRAPLDLQALWAVSVTKNYFVYWMVVRILSSPGLVDRIRKETKSSVKASQPEAIFNFPEPPRLKVYGRSLFTACPLLKACYLETLRLDSSPWSIGRVRADVVLSKDQGGLDDKPKSFVLERGMLVIMGKDLHCGDPRYFRGPGSFIPERYLDERKMTPHQDQAVRSDDVQVDAGQSSLSIGWLMAER